MSVKLPEGIDYSKYYGNSGANTKYWGSRLWDSLFVSIIARYPVRINTSDDLEIKQAFKYMLTSLSVMLPCIFCRNSFKGFLEELPIEPYLIGRIELMYWLYQMKDKVNKKLIKSEHVCYNNEKAKLKAMFYTKEITEDEYYKRVQVFKGENFMTIPTPSFKEVLDKYESQRARCDPRAKKCSLPKKNYPDVGEE
jgi:hypothetical protein